MGSRSDPVSDPQVVALVFRLPGWRLQAMS